MLYAVSKSCSECVYLTNEVAMVSNHKCKQQKNKFKFYLFLLPRFELGSPDPESDDIPMCHRDSIGSVEHLHDKLNSFWKSYFC